MTAAEFPGEYREAVTRSSDESNDHEAVDLPRSDQVREGVARETARVRRGHFSGREDGKDSAHLGAPSVVERSGVGNCRTTGARRVRRPEVTAGEDEVGDLMDLGSVRGLVRVALRDEHALDHRPALSPRGPRLGLPGVPGTQCPSRPTTLPSRPNRPALSP